MIETSSIEVEFNDFRKSVEIARSLGHKLEFKNCYLLDLNATEELPIIKLEQKTCQFKKKNGELKNIPFLALSNWTVLLPTSHILNQQKFLNPNGSEAKRPIINFLKSQGLPVNYECSLDDLSLISQCWKTEYQNTTKNLRHDFYSAVKKLENLPQYAKDSFIIGRNMLEKWSSRQTYRLKADVLIHLAYYRRWTRDIEAALEVTKCLEGQNYNIQLSDKERSILATERAAAFLDLYEKYGKGLAEAHRFLRYSYAANGGKSSPENSLCWQRYERLVKSDLVHKSHNT